METVLVCIFVKSCVMIHKPIFSPGPAFWRMDAPYGRHLTKIDYDDGDFPQLGEEYEKSYPVSQGFVGMANCRLIDMYSLCQYGFTWMNQHRSVVK